MSTYIAAPYPNLKDTTTLPDHQFEDPRRNESTLQIKRTKKGVRRTYINPSTRQTLVLPFVLSRQKSLELEAFVKVYQTARWHLTLYDGSTWQADLVGEPVSRTASGRYSLSARTGLELIEVTLTLSAQRLT